MTLGEREQAAVRSVLDGLERDVGVRLELGPTATPVTLLAAGGRELDSNGLTRDLVESVCALSERVSLAPADVPVAAVGAALVGRRKES